MLLFEDIMKGKSDVASKNNIREREISPLFKHPQNAN